MTKTLPPEAAEACTAVSRRTERNGANDPQSFGAV
jgi:hypothetical protein